MLLPNTVFLQFPEVLDAEQIPLMVQYVDILQVGARNMQNFALLKKLGQCGKPVFLKRGFSATYQDLLMAAEYILGEGNPQVILCERELEPLRPTREIPWILRPFPFCKSLHIFP